jgi:hypothetical protein
MKEILLMVKKVMDYNFIRMGLNMLGNSKVIKNKEKGKFFGQKVPKIG